MEGGDTVPALDACQTEEKRLKQDRMGQIPMGLG